MNTRDSLIYKDKNPYQLLLWACVNVYFDNEIRQIACVYLSSYWVPKCVLQSRNYMPTNKTYSLVCLRLHSLFKFSACRMLRRITDCNLMAMVVRRYGASAWILWVGLFLFSERPIWKKTIDRVCIKFNIYLIIVHTVPICICLQSKLRTCCGTSRH